MKIPSLIAILYLQLLSFGLQAEEQVATSPAKPVVDPLSGSNISQLAIGLVFVILLVVAAGWILRRVGGVNLGGSGALRVVGGMSMGARERVVLLQVGEEQLLVGVTPGRIQTLHVLDKPVEFKEAGSTESGFAARLADALKGKQQGSQS